MDLTENQRRDEWLMHFHEVSREFQRLLEQAVAARNLGHAVDRTFANYDTLLLEHEHEGGVRVTAMSSTGAGRRSVSGADLPDVLAAVMGDEEPRKRCLGPCGLTKPLRQFSRYKKSADQRNIYCLTCERARVKAAKGKKNP